MMSCFTFFRFCFYPSRKLISILIVHPRQHIMMRYDDESKTDQLLIQSIFEDSCRSSSRNKFSNAPAPPVCILDTEVTEMTFCMIKLVPS